MARAEYALGTINAATDLMIAALPIRAIWRLQLVRRQKIALVLILSLGWLYVSPLPPILPNPITPIKPTSPSLTLLS
jgi:hypothetical protein